MAEATAIDRLSTAAARGDLEEIHNMLQSNVDVNERNKYGRTPLQVSLANLSSAAMHKLTGPHVLAVLHLK